MNCVDTGQFHVRDVWICASLFLLVYILEPFFLYSLSIPLPTELIGLIGVTLSFVIPIVYFTFRYGPVNLLDLIPRITDVPVLFGSVVVVFLWVSLVMLSGGISSDDIITEIRALGSLERFGSYFLVIFLDPFLEEIFFRKYVLEILRRRYTVMLAILITVALETGFHFPVVKYGVRSLIIIFCYSLFLTIIYLKSRLGVSVLAHSLISCSITILSA